MLTQVYVPPKHVHIPTQSHKLQRCTTVQITYVCTTRVRTPKTPNREPPHGSQTATEPPYVYTQPRGTRTDPHDTPGVHTHPSHVDPRYTDTILNLFSPLGTGPGPKELCSADENIPPASTAPALTPCSRQQAVHLPLVEGGLLEEDSGEME